MIYEVFLYMLFLFGVAGWWLSPKTNNKLFYLCGIYLICIVCLRNKAVGIDTQDYIGFFTSQGGVYGTFKNPNEKLEIGLPFLGHIYQVLGLEKHYYLPYIFFNGLISTIPFLWLTKKYSTNPCFSLFIIFVALRGAFMVIFVAALRQAISMSFSLISLYYLREKKAKYKVKFIIASILSVLFHNTGFITAIILICADHLKLSKRKTYIILVLVFFISFIITQYGAALFSETITIINLLTTDRYDYYSTDKSLDVLDRSVYSICINLILPFIVVYLSSDEKVKNDIFIKMYIFAPSVFLFFGAFEQISRMVSIYWIIGAIGAFPERKTIQNSKFKVLIIIVSAFMLSRAFLMYSGADGISNGLAPYKFYWE